MNCFIFRINPFFGPVYFAEDSADGIVQAGGVSARRIAGSAEVRGQEGKQRFQARMVGGKVSEDLFERGLCLPSGTAMTEEDLDRVIEVVRKCHRR